MKISEPASTIATWPYGITVEISEAGLLLKPKPKPRQGWARAFKAPQTSSDETATLRQVKNKFDDAEWEW